MCAVVILKRYHVTELTWRNFSLDEREYKRGKRRKETCLWGQEQQKGRERGRERIGRDSKTGREAERERNKQTDRLRRR